MDMTPDRWRHTSEYLHEVFGREDDALAQLKRDAAVGGLPDIAISAEVGRLLMMMTTMTKGRLALEVGTLGGYSSIWIARGLSASGRLITIEMDDRHADFAQQQLARCGMADRVEIRRGKALEVLPKLARELSPQSVDVVFLDAEKTEYPEYWRLVKPLIAVGGLIIADNVCGSNNWWIDKAGNPSRDGADRFNRLVAGDSDFQAVAVPLRQGVLIGRRIR